MGTAVSPLENPFLCVSPLPEAACVPQPLASLHLQHRCDLSSAVASPLLSSCPSRPFLRTHVITLRLPGWSRITSSCQCLCLYSACKAPFAWQVPWRVPGVRVWSPLRATVSPSQFTYIFILSGRVKKTPPLPLPCIWGIIFPHWLTLGTTIRAWPRDVSVMVPVVKYVGKESHEHWDKPAHRKYFFETIFYLGEPNWARSVKIALRPFLCNSFCSTEIICGNNLLDIDLFGLITKNFRVWVFIL